MLHLFAMLPAFVLSAQPSASVGLWGEVTPTRLRLGDVVFVEVSARNYGDSSVQIPAMCLLETGTLTVEIADREESTTFRFLPDGCPAGEETPKIDLGPGEQRVLGVLMLPVPRLDWTEWRFWDPDKWRSGDYYLDLRCGELAGRSEKLFIEGRSDEEMRRLLALYDGGVRAPVPTGWDVDRPGLGTFGLLSFPAECSRPENLATLEKTLSPGSLRDLVHVARLTVQVYDSVSIDEKRTRARELLDWIDTRPKLQRTYFYARLANWARDCGGLGQFMFEFGRQIDARAGKPCRESGVLEK